MTVATPTDTIHKLGKNVYSAFLDFGSRHPIMPWPAISSQRPRTKCENQEILLRWDRNRTEASSSGWLDNGLQLASHRPSRSSGEQVANTFSHAMQLGNFFELSMAIIVRLFRQHRWLLDWVKHWSFILRKPWSSPPLDHLHPSCHCPSQSSSYFRNSITCCQLHATQL